MCSAYFYGWGLKKLIATITSAITKQGLYGEKQRVTKHRHSRALRVMSQLRAFHTQGQLRLLPQVGMVLGCTAGKNRESAQSGERQGQKPNAVPRFVWLSILGIVAVGCAHKKEVTLPRVPMKVYYYRGTCHKQSDGSYICKARFNPLEVRASGAADNYGERASKQSGPSAEGEGK